MDLAKVTGSDIRSKLHTHFAHQLMRHEIKLHQMRTSRDQTALRRYYNSTTNRAMVARLLVIAYFDAKEDDTYLGITKSECAQALNVSLNSASEVIAHSLLEGWAVESKDSAKHFQAAAELIDSTEEYAHRNFELIASDLVSVHAKLIQFDTIATSHLDFTDDSKTE